MKVTLNHLTKRWSHEQHPVVDLLWFNAGCTGLQEFECFLTQSTGLKELLVLLYILQTVPTEILHENVFPFCTWSQFCSFSRAKNKTVWCWIADDCPYFVSLKARKCDKFRGQNCDSPDEVGGGGGLFFHIRWLGEHVSAALSTCIKWNCLHYLSVCST